MVKLKVWNYETIIITHYNIDYCNISLRLQHRSEKQREPIPLSMPESISMQSISLKMHTPKPKKLIKAPEQNLYL